MNPDTRQFEPIPEPLPPDDHRAEWPRFTVGEEVPINGVTFVVRKVTKKDLVLRPKR